MATLSILSCDKKNNNDDDDNNNIYGEEGRRRRFLSKKEDDEMAMLRSTTVFGVLLPAFLIGMYLAFTSIEEEEEYKGSLNVLSRLKSAPYIHVDKDDSSFVTETNRNCHYYNCFDVYRCGRHHKKMLVTIEPFRNFPDSTMSKEFVQVLEAVMTSDYYTDDPNSACVFITPIDTLNERVLTDSQRKRISIAMTKFPFWNDGRNHLIFTMLPGSKPEYRPEFGVSIGSAMIAGAGLSSHAYRMGFDISIPTFVPFITTSSILSNVTSRTMDISNDAFLLVSTQINLKREHENVLFSLSDEYPSEFAIFRRCANGGNASFSARCSVRENTPSSMEIETEILKNRAIFCLILPEIGLTQPLLMESLQSGCIPVIAIDSLVLPFSEVLDWKRFSIRIYERELNDVVSIVRRISGSRIFELKAQIRFIYETYFASISAVTSTTLKILNDRIFPHFGRSSFEWNSPIRESILNPFLYQPSSSTSLSINDGFTAVILTYNRLNSLFEIITRLSEVPSLTRILVIWNNPDTVPPPMSSSSLWPKISKDLKIIRSAENRLTNRFIPYDEIITECVLSMDDDLLMLTSDELEFGYRVWKEFPDRIVGFPSRTHVEDGTESKKWKYESEWTSEISMVLTGAAFYHKYWNYVFSKAESPALKNIKRWVDSHMNCEDIAMNFLVANRTGKAPIKVTPRKKFKCSTPQCLNVDMLSGVQSHMMERTECVNFFVKEYGSMPLRTVDFRADPVLYKDSVPEKLKLFSHLGSL